MGSLVVFGHKPCDCRKFYSGTNQEINSEQMEYSNCIRVSVFHVSFTAKLGQYVWLLSICRYNSQLKIQIHVENPVQQIGFCRKEVTGNHSRMFYVL